MKTLHELKEELLEKNLSPIERDVYNFLISHPEYVDDLQKVDSQKIGNKGDDNG